MPKVRFRYQTVELGGKDFHLRSLRDRQQCPDDITEAEACGISSATWPLFGILWQSEELLATIVLDEEIANRRILEVGCGLGLASLLLQGRGADITAMDYHPDAKHFLDYNARLNDLEPIPFARTSWLDPNPELGLFDTIIGSDVLYDRHNLSPLLEFIITHAAAGSTILLVDPRRGLTGPFTRLLSARGFTPNVTDFSHTSHDGTEKNCRVLRFVRD
ncbi:MAG: methyltransferase domain-containing protein [Pseudomonadales bacterium]|nr:methyltransferase domain-containing protein [Pseudomonadales bacterium]